MLQFWRHGYEATSLRDLTRAMGVSAPSIYAAFGDKKTLFQEVVRRYTAGPKNAEAIIAGAPNARQACAGLLHAAACGFTGEATPPGCLLVNSSVCSAAAADLQAALAAIRQDIEAALRGRLEDGRARGELPAGCEPATQAALTMAVIQGMATLAHDGASREKLLTVAGAALLAWPIEERPNPCP